MHVLRQVQQQTKCHNSCKQTCTHPLDGSKQAARNLHQQRPPLHKAGNEVGQGGALHSEPEKRGTIESSQ